ncbi:MAG: hypothetical protein M3238_01835 [Actinomycetota bacterium]|nr:hypothetical protein [Actinomycetota bacterium]
MRETASATWLLPTRYENRFIWYFAWATRIERVGTGRHGIAAIGKGRCVRQSRRPGAVLLCDASRFVRGNVNRALRMGALGHEAVLQIKRGDRKHVARWTTRRARLYHGDERCRAGRGVSAGLDHVAAASGRLFGKRLKATRRSSAVLHRSVIATQCRSMRIVEFDPAANRLRAVIHLPADL